MTILYTDIGVIRRRRLRALAKTTIILASVLMAAVAIGTALYVGLERGEQQKKERQDYMCRYYGADMKAHFGRDVCAKAGA